MLGRLLQGRLFTCVGLGCAMDELAAIFERSLPSVDEPRKRALLQGLRVYHCKYKSHRDDLMNYEDSEEYQNELFTLSTVGLDDFWVYSPQFKKVMALCISHLFKTKITEVSLNSPVFTNQGTVFLDKHLNWWLMLVYAHEKEPDKLKIMMRFPRSNAKVQRANLVSDKTANDPKFHQPLCVTDASLWHEA